MSNSNKTGGKGPTSREKRLAEALRANLRRRKAQAKARADVQKDTGTAPRSRPDKPTDEA